MKVKMTRGAMGEHGKDYVIETECGQTVRCYRRGPSASFDVPAVGLEAVTVAAAKAAIEAAISLEQYDDDDEPEVMTVFERGPSAAALLALVLAGELVPGEVLIECLDNAGFIENGNIDRAAARRQLERWSGAR